MGTPIFKLDAKLEPYVYKFAKDRKSCRLMPEFRELNEALIQNMSIIIECNDKRIEIRKNC